MKSKKIVFILLLLLILTGCGQRSKVIQIEAEEGSRTSGQVETRLSGYSGEGYVTGLTYLTDSIKLTAVIEEEEEYLVQVICQAPSGTEKTFFDVYIDGERGGFISVPKGDTWGLARLEAPIKLAEGQHKIVLINCQSDTKIDAIRLTKVKELKEETMDTEIKLITPSPHRNVVKLYTYLEEIYGKNILSGQQEQGNTETEIEMIKEVTGKEPAVRGFDFIEYSSSRVARGSTSQDTAAAIEWWKSGGIVTFCWHWNAPMHLIDKAPDQYWYMGFYTKATTFDLEAALRDKESEEYKALLKDIDIVAKELKILEKAGVPVLWRPLHEAAGGWFWWGAKGPEPYKELWRLLYDKLVNEYELTHLIWVWNGQSKAWYPGDDYVDIISEDIYPDKKDYSSQSKKFIEASSYTEANKLIALSENGVIPDPDNLIKDKAKWLWFCTWGGEFVMDKAHNYSDEYTEKEMLIKVYTHEYVITKDELPDFIN